MFNILPEGAASLLPVKLRYEIEPRYILPPEGFDDFIFANGPVKEGLVRRGEALDPKEDEGRKAE